MLKIIFDNNSTSILLRIVIKNIIQIILTVGRIFSRLAIIEKANTLLIIEVLAAKNR